VLLILVATVVVIALTRGREKYITLDEVISGSRVVSLDEGIVEYNGSYFLLGTHDLKRRKYLIELLDLLKLENPSVVDLRFDTQIIIKEGSGAYSGS
jgi:hypothetical protein